MPKYRTEVMRPSDIGFIQSDVSPDLNGQDLLQVFEQLVKGQLRAEDAGLIEVVRYQGMYFAVNDNRRLLLFKVSTCQGR